MRALDLFDGCGGAAEGLRSAGYDVTGVEHWPTAVESSRAAGHRVIEADVRAFAPWALDGYDHLHASPPCPTFSSAGKGHGRAYVLDLAEAVKRVLHGEPHGLDGPDEMTLLTLEPARILAELRPSTISFEQVRAVLPIWEAYADGLRSLGYSAWAGLISAETLGVPQTRVRAWLGARLDGEARPPTATHSAYYSRDPQRLDDGVAPWVSMAKALGWGMTERPSYTVCAGGADTGGAEPFANSSRKGMILARSAVASGRWQPRQPDAPSSTLTHSADSWVWATPDLSESIKLEVSEALVLQGFPADYPLVGTRTAQFKQIGNAVPPPVAQAVVEELNR